MHGPTVCVRCRRQTFAQEIKSNRSFAQLYIHAAHLHQATQLVFLRYQIPFYSYERTSSNRVAGSMSPFIMVKRASSPEETDIPPAKRQRTGPGGRPENSCCPDNRSLCCSASLYTLSSSLATTECSDYGTSKSLPTFGVTCSRPCHMFCLAGLEASRSPLTTTSQYHT